MLCKSAAKGSQSDLEISFKKSKYFTYKQLQTMGLNFHLFGSMNSHYLDNGNLFNVTLVQYFKFASSLVYFRLAKLY